MNIRALLLIALGVLVIAGGASWIYPPLGIIVIGVALIVVAVVFVIDFPEGEDRS